MSNYLDQLESLLGGGGGSGSHNSGRIKKTFAMKPEWIEDWKRLEGEVKSFVKDFQDFSLQMRARSHRLGHMKAAFWVMVENDLHEMGNMGVNLPKKRIELYEEELPDIEHTIQLSRHPAHEDDDG